MLPGENPFETGKIQRDGHGLSKVLKSLTPDLIEPIIKEFTGAKKTNPTDNFGFAEGLKPIATFADKDVVYTLNKYFYSV